VSEENKTPRKPVILGGSLTRSPDGNLQALQTHGLYPTPQGVQEVWTFARQRRYPASWQGQPLPDVGYVIQFRPTPITIACDCGHSLGKYVPYQAQDEQGIVEDTSRRYEPELGGPRKPASRVPRRQPRFKLESSKTQFARKTTAIFTCPSCGKEHKRNLARLGQTLWQSDGSSFVLD
jgi:hypothetical protein